MSRRFQIASLDGIRALSILIVFLSHAGLSSIIPGIFGVTVFFFLSGYLITTLLRLEHEKSGRIHLGDFYLRRILRIFPPFYFVLLAVVLLTVIHILPGSFQWPTVEAEAAQMYNLWEIFGYHGEPPGTGVFWSLAVEEHFYLIFPLLYLGLRKWLPQPFHQFLALALMAVLVLVWRYMLIKNLHFVELTPCEIFYPRIDHATDTRFDSLLFGCMLAIYGNPALDQTRFSRAIWLGVFVPISMLALLTSFIIRDPLFRETFRYSLQGVTMFSLFIAVVRFPDWIGFRFLNWRSVRFVGVLSFSIYLIHAAILIGIEFWCPKLLPHFASMSHPFQLIVQGIIGCILSLGIASLIYAWLELPCARLRKKLSHLTPKR